MGGLGQEQHGCEGGRPPRMIITDHRRDRKTLETQKTHTFSQRNVRLRIFGSCAAEALAVAGCCCCFSASTALTRASRNVQHCRAFDRVALAAASGRGPVSLSAEVAAA